MSHTTIAYKTNVKMNEPNHEASDIIAQTMAMLMGECQGGVKELHFLAESKFVGEKRNCELTIMWRNPKYRELYEKAMAHCMQIIGSTFRVLEIHTEYQKDTTVKTQHIKLQGIVNKARYN